MNRKEQVKNEATHVRKDNKYVVRPLLVKSVSRETKQRADVAMIETVLQRPSVTESRTQR